MRAWLIRAAVSVAILVSLLAFVPVAEVVDALRRVSLWTCAVGLGALFAGHYLSAVKLRLLIGRAHVPLATCVRAQYAALVASLGFLGLAGGDIARVAYLVPAAGARRTTLAAVADRLIDTAALVFVIGLALPLAGWPPALANVDLHLGWVAAAAVACMAAAPFLIRLGVRRSARLARLWEARTHVHGMRRAIATAFTISCVVQTGFVAANFVIARELGVAIALAPWFVAWPLAKLTSVLPISLGGFGVREAAVVVFLVSFGAPADRVLATALVWQVLIGVSGVSGLAITQLLRARGPQKPVEYRWTER